MIKPGKKKVLLVSSVKKIIISCGQFISMLPNGFFDKSGIVITVTVFCL